MKHFFTNYTTMFLLIIFTIIIYPLPNSNAEQSARGTFYIVSLGIGDPDNITVRALNTIEKSDIIYCSKEAGDSYQDILEGKEVYPRPGNHIHKYLQSMRGEKMMGTKTKAVDSDTADEIMKEIDAFITFVKNALNNGKTVSLLEYGDPTIYGPYIWIMDALKDVEPVIVPGVSSFNAANAALKKGLTFGIDARSAILTNAADLREDYQGADTLQRLGANRSSMVFFTMFVDFEKLIKELRKYYPADTPVAIVIEAGYKEKERIIRGTLNSIMEKTKGKDIPFKHLIYVGDFLKDHWEIF